jgi:hypothetical protein
MFWKLIYLLYIDVSPKKSAEDKGYGPFPAAVIKTEEQQKFGKTLFQAY